MTKTKTTERVKDCKGRVICPGDLVRTYHFRDRRWGHQWLYHVVCDVGKEKLELVPAECLNPTNTTEGGRSWLTADHGKDVEIIHGGGKYPHNMYRMRDENGQVS